MMTKKICPLLFALFAMATGSAIAADPVTLIAPGAVWRYLDNGSNQGTNWIVPEFVDATWAAGPAELGYGDGDEVTVVNQGPATSRFITTYFRHHFLVTNAQDISGLHVRLLRDDGGVVYLNGREIFRSNMPQGPITYSTTAPIAVAGAEEVTYFTNSVDPTLLINGTNVLAVEMHQTSGQSSDISFNLGLHGMVPGTGNVGPTVMVTSPANGTAFTEPATINIEATASDADGSVTNVAFYNNGTKLADDAGAPYSFTWSPVPAGGYQLRAVATDNLGVSSTSAPVSISVTSTNGPLVASNAVWRYLDTGANLGTAWVDPAFDDSTWNSGPAQLGYGDGDEATVVMKGNPTYITTYFRHSFGVPDPSLFTYLTIRLQRDDGGIVYLNGREVFRSNMPPGPVDYQTLAPGVVGGADENTMFPRDVSTNHLVAGVNVLAVEIHQQLQSSSDISFALELVGNRGPLSNNLPSVTLTGPADQSTYTEPAIITLNASATDSGGSVDKVEFFQGSTKLGEDTAAPFSYVWSDVPVGTYQLFAIATDNFGAKATSAVATVYVTVSTAPTLSSVTPAPGTVSMLTNVTVTFSEAVDGVNASDLLINGTPATGLSGSNATYTFSFQQPPEGAVGISWASGHGIVDRESTPKPFDALAAGATWQYTLVDSVAPTVVKLSPAPGATITQLREIEVTFSEPVGGVQSSDLLINGAPATDVSGSLAGPYVFEINQPPPGPINVSWASGHGIRDFASAQNPFAGGSWTYTLNTNLVQTAVVINEIMFHPSSEREDEEYIELLNTGPVTINLTGWRLRGGVSFTFPNVTLAPNRFIVVAANAASFSAKYPAVTNVIGDWRGVLSNTGEEIELENAAGQRVDRLEYADEGDWAVRIRSPFFPQGWTWADDADGGGSSMELMTWRLPNDSGQNWAASVTAQGTPGTTNSVVDVNGAPLVLDVKHFPFVPKSTDPVTITAQIRDETTTVNVQLFHRIATNIATNAFTSTAMFDDGAHGDGAAADGVFGVVLPAQADGTVVEFYVRAADMGSNVRTWPAPARQSDGTTFAQTCNALYQVDDQVYSGSQPFYRLIMTETERALLEGLNNTNAFSNAEMNGTFISSDGVETKVRYLIGIRHRGQGSRGARPPNYRVNIPSDRRWNGVTAFALNTRFTHSQLAGSVVSRKAGVHSEETIAVQVRVNGANLANAGSPMYGSYAHLEEIDTDFAENHFPLDPNGNIYRGTRDGAGGTLAYRGTNVSQYRNNGYTKQSNVSEDDWSDLINLTFVLNNTPDSEYPAAVRRVVNVEEWVRYFAMMIMVGYGETSIGSNGDGDDYSMYRGINDPRFLLLPHDHDTDFGQGDSSRLAATSPIFRATANPVVNRFLRHPEFVPLFYAELKRMCDTTFSTAEIEPLFDQILGDWVPPQVVADMKTWVANRCSFVLSQIPVNLTVNSSLLVSNGYYRATSPTISLSGTGNVIDTRFIRVNGIIAQWSPVGGTWSVSDVPVQPGINRVTVQALDVGGQEIASTFIEIWYDDGTTTTASGTISGNTTWTAGAGPYYVSNNITVSAGVTLTIEPGTSVYFTQGTSLTINGRLLAEGTPSRRIQFTREPGTANTWGGIRFNNSLIENRIAYADVEFAATADPIVATGSTILIDNVVFSGTTRTVIELSNSSALIRNSVFPSIVDNETIHGNGMPAGGYVIIEGNYFGGTTGYSDIIDFTGGQRPGPILQVLNNFFSSGSDDGLDLDGTDTHIEGNIFQHIHQDAPRDSAAHAIATDNNSEITVARNVFYDNDHAVLLKGGAFLTAHNNTIVGSTIAAIAFDETNRTVTAGRGAYLDGNILWGNAALFKHLYFNTPGEANTDLTVHRSIMQGTNYPGIGNLNLDPLFVDATNDFHLRPGSPAIGAGPNGLDMGAHVPQWASISGEPLSPTPLTTATLRVGGPGITHYRYRVNNGPYGAETSVSNSITLSGLTNGAYTVFVIGKNSASVYQSQTEPTVSKAWTVNTSIPGIRINEVLARNDSAVPVGSRFPDLIELYNGGSTSVDLTGMGITDNPDEPYKFFFPPGTVVAPGTYRVLYADNETTPPGLHLGFSIKQEGDEIFLFHTSGRLIDSVRFGPQVPDLSIGRLAAGAWGLTRPTFGTNNVAQRTGDPLTLKINEWLADGVTPYADDFIELFNPDPQPVSLGGLFLSDNPIGAPNLHEIAPLSFIAGGGFAVFIADGETDRGPEHVNFQLSPEQGMIGLSAPDSYGGSPTLIDCVIYGPQSTDISQGRQPNGAVTFGFFDVPTPGSPNPGVIIPDETVTINEVLAFNTVTTNSFGNSPDFIELYNPSGNVLNLSDMSLSDNPAEPRRFVFPPGSTIPPLGFKIIQFDNDLAASATNANFGLEQSGGAVYLFDNLGNGGSLLSSVAYGLQAADFSLSRVPNGSTNWVLGQVTLGAPNIAVAALGDVLELKINEWMANPSSGDDWFEVYNPNAQPVALGLLYLSDNLTSRTKHRIAPLSFIGSGAHAYQRFEADNNTGAGADHVSFALSQNGEALVISTTTGASINQVSFGPQASGVSEGRLPDGSPTIVSFPTTPTPGDANFLPLSNVVINEVLAHSDPPFEDAIELHNISAASVNISGWYLSDSKNALRKFQIPTNTILAAGGFKVFYENDFNADPNSPLSFSLNSARGDEVHLAQAVTGALTGFRATARFGASENGVAIGRYVTSVGADFTALSRRTFGTNDSPDTSNEFRMGTGLPNAYPKVGPIVISEIMYHPPDSGTNDNLVDEFVELQNISTASVPLFHTAYPTNTWRLRDGISFNFPQGSSLPAGGHLLVVAFDPVTDAATVSAFRSKYSLDPSVPIYGPYSGKLDNGGESVELYKPDLPQLPPDPDAGFVPYVLADRVKYSDTLPWPVAADGGGASLQRISPDEYGNDPINWMAANPTPGPGQSDSDGDGMPDSWEQQYFGSPTTANPNADPDGDGLTNLNEYRAGTDPQDPDSSLKLRISRPGNILLEFTAASNKSYTIEYSDSLEPGNWIRLQDFAPTPGGGPMQATDTPPGGRRFYRLRTPESP